MSRRCVVSTAVLSLALAASATTRAVQVDVRSGLVVRLRIVDPHGLRTPTLRLLAWHQDGPHSSSGVPVSGASDGAFGTLPLRRGTYVVEAFRSTVTTGPTNPSEIIGLEVVSVDTAKDVVVTLRRPFALTGHILLADDPPQGSAPKDVTVLANLALDGMEIMATHVSERGADGTFVLRNAYGPRILRFGYRVESGPMWWPSRVLLDGRDVTNVPTDFSEHPNARLEVVFSQRPARIVGLVTDVNGRPVPQAWVAAIGDDTASVQPWSTTANVVRANDRGQYSIVMPPGEYRVHALPGGTWATYQTARPELSRIAFGGVKVTAKDRTFIRVDLTVQAR